MGRTWYLKYRKVYVFVGEDGATQRILNLQLTIDMLRLYVSICSIHVGCPRNQVLYLRIIFLRETYHHRRENAQAGVILNYLFEIASSLNIMG